MKKIIFAAFLTTVALALAWAQSQPQAKAIAMHVLVDKYVHNAIHGDTEIGPIFYDESTLVVQQPKEQAGRRLVLLHRQLAAFTMTNAVLHIGVRQSTLEGTNQTVRLAEDDIIGSIRLIEQRRP